MITPTIKGHGVVPRSGLHGMELEITLRFAHIDSLSLGTDERVCAWPFQRSYARPPFLSGFMFLHSLPNHRRRVGTLYTTAHAATSTTHPFDDPSFLFCFGIV